MDTQNGQGNAAEVIASLVTEGWITAGDALMLEAWDWKSVYQYAAQMHPTSRAAQSVAKVVVDRHRSPAHSTTSLVVMEVVMADGTVSEEIVDRQTVALVATLPAPRV